MRVFNLRYSLAAAALAATTLISSASAEILTWSDSTGRFTIQAEYVGSDGTAVQLRKADGSMISVPLARLSDASRTLAQQMAKGQASAGVSSTRMPAASDTTGSATATIGAEVPPMTLAQTVDFIESQMLAANPAVLYEILPPSYHEEIDGLLALAGSKIDQRVINSLAGLLDDAAAILKQKKQFVFGSSLWPTPPDPKFARIYDAAVSVVDNLIDPRVVNTKAMAAGDTRAFIAAWAKATGPSVQTLNQAIQAAGLVADYNDMNVSFDVVEEDSERGVVRGTKPDGETKDMPFVKVEGRWVPEAWQEDFAAGVAEAKQDLESLNADEQNQAVEAIEMSRQQMNMQASQISSQEQFDAMASGLAMMLPMMMNGMGGGGPGGFGGPAFPEGADQPEGFGPPQSSGPPQEFSFPEGFGTP